MQPPLGPIPCYTVLDTASTVDGKFRALARKTLRRVDSVDSRMELDARIENLAGEISWGWWSSLICSANLRGTLGWVGRLIVSGKPEAWGTDAGGKSRQDIPGIPTRMAATTYNICKASPWTPGVPKERSRPHGSRRDLCRPQSDDTSGRKRSLRLASTLTICLIIPDWEIWRTREYWPRRYPCLRTDSQDCYTPWKGDSGPIFGVGSILDRMKIIHPRELSFSHLPCPTVWSPACASSTNPLTL